MQERERERERDWLCLRTRSLALGFLGVFDLPFFGSGEPSLLLPVSITTFQLWEREREKARVFEFRSQKSRNEFVGSAIGEESRNQKSRRRFDENKESPIGEGCLWSVRGSAIGEGSLLDRWDRWGECVRSVRVLCDRWEGESGRSESEYFCGVQVLCV